MTKDELIYEEAREKVFKCFRTSETIAQLRTSEKVMQQFIKLFNPAIEIQISMQEHFEGRLRGLQQ